MSYHCRNLSGLPFSFHFLYLCCVWKVKRPAPQTARSLCSLFHDRAGTDTVSHVTFQKTIVSSQRSLLMSHIWEWSRSHHHSLRSDGDDVTILWQKRPNWHAAQQRCYICSQWKSEPIFNVVITLIGTQESSHLRMVVCLKGEISMNSAMAVRAHAQSYW